MPIFVLLAAFIGGMSVAADVTAGERERGSLESLLLHPVSRLAIVGGKWLAVSAVVGRHGDAGDAHVSCAVMQHPRLQNLDLPDRLVAGRRAGACSRPGAAGAAAAAVQLLIAFQAQHLTRKRRPSCRC